MKRNFIRSVFTLGLIFPCLTAANISEDDFKVKTTRNLINLCTASKQDSHYREAIHFCHGYLVGAFHYYLAETANAPGKGMVCFPEPRPSRNQAIDRFVAWAQKHPQFMTEIPVETEFRFLIETWPCKNKK